MIRGVGVVGDGRAAGLMAPRTEGQVAAIRQAWTVAGLDPTQPGAVGLIEAHGTATVAGDATELASLATVFGPAGPAGADIGIGSVKSMIGHAMPAAGAAGLIKAALALHEHLLPPTLHCEDPHPALSGTRFAPITAAREWRSDGPRRAAVNAFGFGGINAHVVLSEHTAGATGTHRSRRSARRSEAEREQVLLLAGPDLESVATELARSDTELLARDDSLAPPTTGPVRLAMVAPDARRLELARRVVAQGKAGSGRRDLWLATAPLLGMTTDGASAGGRAFLSPGLEESFAPRVDDVAAHFGLPPVRTTAGAGLLGRRGLELAAVGRVLDAGLQALDIRPDAVAGHSIGEWSALIAAGAAPFEEFADSTRAFDAGPGVPDLVFAVLGCGAQAAVEAIGELPDVVLSHDNCPHQSIICGEQSQVAEVLGRLRVDGVTGSVLPFRSGFHTPYLEPYLGPTREFVSGLTLRRAQVPLWSATTVERYPEDPDEVRRLLLRNLVEPVRFGPLIRRLHESGIRVFVQVGTGSLPGFVEDTLESVGTAHLALSANVPRRSGLQQLRRVAAALWTVGAAPAFGRLSGSPAQPEAPAHPRPTPRPTGPDASGRLRLGAPLIRDLGIRLDTPTHPPRSCPAPPSPPWPAGDPVLAEYSALLADLAGAATDVMTAARPEVVPAAPAVVHHEPAPASDAPPTPPSTGPRSRTSTRTLSLDTDPELADHSLLQGPADRPAAECFPLVPLTATVELLIAAAAELIPERRVIGVRGVRALRPLVVDPVADLVIEATEKEQTGEVSVVAVMIGGPGAGGTREPYARATVLLAADYPAPPALREPALIAERPPPIDATALYADRWMFHGPAYQGVTRLSGLAEDGVRGTITALPAPGSLLDAAGQLLGYWVATQSDNGLVLPATVGAISFYGPAPAVGSQFETVVHVRSVAPEEVVADLDLRAADGSLWCHITGWTDRRLQGDARTIEAFRHPARAVLAQQQDDGWWLLAEPWTDPVARDLTCRQYLTPAERADHDSRNPRAARRWLLGRIAAKDAVRSWLWDHGAGPLFPAQIVIGNDAAGRPYATGAGCEGLAPLAGPRRRVGRGLRRTGRQRGRHRRGADRGRARRGGVAHRRGARTAGHRGAGRQPRPSELGHPVLDGQGGRREGGWDRPRRPSRPVRGDFGGFRPVAGGRGRHRTLGEDSNW